MSAELLTHVQQEIFTDIFIYCTATALHWVKITWKLWPLHMLSMKISTTVKRLSLVIHSCCITGMGKMDQRLHSRMLILQLVLERLVRNVKFKCKTPGAAKVRSLFEGLILRLILMAIEVFLKLGDCIILVFLKSLRVFYIHQ